MDAHNISNSDDKSEQISPPTPTGEVFKRLEELEMNKLKRLE